MSAASAQLTWATEAASTLTGGMPAVYVSNEGLLRRGFDLQIGSMNLGWFLVACGTAAAALLVWDAPYEVNSRVNTVQTSLGIAVVIAAILHLSFAPGVIAAGLGGGMIAAGTRLSQACENPQ